MKTKIIYIFFFIVSFTNAFGQSLEQCDQDNFLNLHQFNSLYKNDCEFAPNREEEYCRCINTSSNILIQSLKDETKLDELKISIQSNYKDRLLGLYAQMNFGAGMQEMIYSMNPNEKQTACTPTILAEKFQEAIYAYHGVQSEEFSIGKFDISNCSEDGCQNVFKKVNDRFEKMKTSEAYKIKQQAYETVTSASSSCQRAGGLVINKVGAVELKIDFSQAFDKTGPLLGQTAEFEDDVFTKEEKQYLSKVKDFFSKHNGLLSDMDYLDNIDSMLGIDSHCKSMGMKALYDLIVFEYQVKASAVGEDVKLGETKLTVVTDLQKDFEKNDKKIVDKIAGSMKTTKLPNACIDYDVFKAINSVPDQNLLNEWSRMDEKSIARSLDPVNLIFKGETQSLNFLKSNPLLAKLISSSAENRSVLATSIKKLSDASRGQGRASQAELFTKFMKTDVSKMVDEDPFADLYQCQRLAESFAAVFTSDSLPPLPLNNDASMQGVAHNLLSCKVIDRNKNVDYQIEDVLASNELFQILNPDTSSIGAENDNAYKDFLDKNCSGFEKFKSDYVAKNCQGDMSCAEEFNVVNSTKRNELKSEFLKGKPELAILEKTINDNISRVDVEKLKDVTDESKQDMSKRSFYDQNVSSRVRRPLYSSYKQGFSGPSSKDISKILEKSKASYEDTVPDPIPQIAQSYNSANYLPPSTKRSVQSPQTNGKNPGFFTPSFLSNSPKLDPLPSVNSASDISKGLKNLNDLPQDDQSKFIDQSKKYLASRDPKDAQIAELKKNVAAFDEKIRKTSKKLSRPTTSLTPANTFSTKYNATSSLPNVSKSASRAVTSSVNANVAIISKTQVDRAAVSYQKALNQIHEKSLPSNQELIVINQQSVMKFSEKPIGEDELAGLIISGDPLTPSKEVFQKISMHWYELEDYLKKNLKVVPENNIISIKCSDSSCEPGKTEMLLNIAMDNNELIISEVVGQLKVAPVDPTHKLIDLSNTINQETKIK